MEQRFFDAPWNLEQLMSKVDQHKALKKESDDEFDRLSESLNNNKYKNHFLVKNFGIISFAMAVTSILSNLFFHKIFILTLLVWLSFNVFNAYMSIKFFSLSRKISRQVKENLDHFDTETEKIFGTCEPIHILITPGETDGEEEYAIWITKQDRMFEYEDFYFVGFTKNADIFTEVDKDDNEDFIKNINLFEEFEKQFNHAE